MEHIERAGVHSGDSISVYPPVSFDKERVEEIIDVTHKLAKALKIVGLMNIQYVISKDKLYVIEVNPRASRTVPYISKVTGVPFIWLAMDVQLGAKVPELGYGIIWAVSAERYVCGQSAGVLVRKLAGVEVSLGPEMKSTGEVLGVDRDYNQAVLKGLIGAGTRVPYDGGKVIVTVADADKKEVVPIAAALISSA